MVKDNVEITITTDINLKKNIHLEITMKEIEKLFDELHELESQYFLTNYNQNSFNAMREKFIGTLSNRLEHLVIPKIAGAIKEIVWMARRYADGRQTFAATSFNDAYDILRDVFGEDIEFNKSGDRTLTEEGKFFPYAQDGGDREIFDSVRGRKPRNTR